MKKEQFLHIIFKIFAVIIVLGFIAMIFIDKQGRQYCILNATWSFAYFSMIFIKDQGQKISDEIIKLQKDLIIHQKRLINDFIKAYKGEK